MNISLIGSGNLATNLGKALGKHGYNIKEVYSHTLANAMTLADTLGAEKFTDSLDDVAADSDLYVIAVKDSVLKDVIKRLCPSRPNGLFVHTAGSMPMQVFQGKAKRYGVLYPLQTFSKARETDFKKIHCFIEGNDEATEQAIDGICQGIFAKVHHVSSENRKYMHLAAVFGCNFVNHCFALSEEILSKANIPFEVMMPLIEETVNKAKVMPPREAQTGPAVRYDRNVMDKHLQLLEDEPDMAEIYKLMSKSIHKMS